MSARSRDALIDETTQLLSSGEPLRGLFPRLCGALSAFLGEARIALALHSPQGARIVFRLPDRDDAVTAELERAALEACDPVRERSGIVAAGMRFGGAAIGGVAAASESRPFTRDDERLLRTWAGILCLRMQQATTEEEIARLHTIAGNDQLTGIANRRSLDARLRDEFDRARSAGESLALCIFDIDYFKPYNDRYGHLAGDGALRRVAQTLKGCAQRHTDFVARYGGEEFVVVLPSATQDEAVKLAEAMRSAVFDLRVPHQASGLGIVTVSCGVSVLSELDADTAELLDRADGELYRAKRAGRNHVAATGYLSQSEAATLPGAGLFGFPAERSDFVGRGKELRELDEAIGRSRLVTIAGPGGAGKTRLAIEAARRHAETFRDGVWFADVSRVRDVDGFFAHLARIFALQTRGLALRDLVLDRLRNAHALLVFDGCEHALEAVRAGVDDLVRGTAVLHVLASSRETLHLPGESILRLLGLAPQDARALFERLAPEATTLERAQREELLESVCRQVDYLPLGIELFAAQAATLTLPRLELLVARRLIPLQSIDEVIRWSVGLLDDRRRQLFAALSVFAGGFTAQAAQAVAGAGPDDLDVLEAKSLIVRVAGEADARYTLLDTMHDFGARSLDEARLESLRNAHFDYYRSLSGASAAILEAERANFAAAFEHARTHRARTEMLAMANALTAFWIKSGHLTEGLHWLQAGIERAGDAAGSELALALRNAGRICRLLSDYGSARDYNERALQMWRSMENVPGIASALNGLALIAHTVGEFERAQVLYEESYKNYEMLGDRLGAAMAINNLGGLSMFRGRYDEAEARLRDAIERAGALGEDGLTALATNNLAELRFLQGRLDDAASLAESSLQARLASNDRPGLAATWLLLGQVKLSQGNAAGAWQPVRESLLSYRDIGDSRGLAIALLATARLLAPQGRTEEASRLVSRSDALVAASGAPLFGAERYVRGLLEDLELPRVDAAADFEAAFEDALATFR